MPQPQIIVEELVKSFQVAERQPGLLGALRGLVRRRHRTVRALDGVSFSLRAGEIVGYIGPNGAGKTTTLRIVGALDPEFGGEVRVAGFDPRTQPLEVKRRVGYLPENAVLYEMLTAAEFLLFVGRMHGLADEVIRSRGGELLEILDLGARLDSRIASLSKGMRQKLLLASALLHNPSILVLDEPLSGLDVNAALLIKGLMRALADSGRAILFSSHVMDVVERLCDRIAILNGGQVVATGSFEELASSLRGGSLEGIFASLTGDGDADERIARAMRALE
jgi:ABC-2 type transport system ATP-binding protein